MKSCRSFLLPLFALSVSSVSLIPVSLIATASSALAQTPEPRLQGALREDTRTLLPGSIEPQVLRAKDLGPLRDTHPIRGITLVFRRSDAQSADLEHLLASQQDPASSEFHHWLTPESFGRRFGIVDADLATTKSWLSGHGFDVTSVSRAHDRITFSGTAAQVSTAFGSILHQFRLSDSPAEPQHAGFQANEELHFAPRSALSLPANLAAITTAILHLSDFRPHPMTRVASHPAYTGATSQVHFLAPRDLAVMYNLPTADNLIGYTPGLGQTIAIVGQSYVDLSISSAVQEFLNTNIKLTPILVPGTGVQAISPGDAFESEIDLEYASGILNAANILLVYVGSNPNYGVFDSLAFAIDQNLAPVISISYGVCETLLSPAELAQGDALFQQAASQGQTLIAASGDAGSTACAPYPVSGGLTSAQQGSLAVGYPAASPYVTAIGGTQMAPHTFDAGSSPYWAAATPPFDTAMSLLSYVPETTWNEDSPSSGLSAGGGGASATIPRPAWQAGVPGIPAGNTRLLPDLSFQASAANPGFLFCTDAVSSGPAANCGYASTSPDSYALAGGTSFAAPTFAAMVALLNQKTLSIGQGNLNPILYRLAADPAKAASVFHDITSGTIACTSSTPGCSAAGQSGFPATVGYDQATGLGSLDFLQLLAAWPTADHSALDSTFTNVYPSTPTLNPGETDVISIFVHPGFQAVETSPSGTVALTVDGIPVTPNLPFSDINKFGDYTGQLTYTFTAPANSGSHVITATYPGDSTHGPSSSTTAVLVGNVLASGSLSLTAASVTMSANGTANSHVTVTPSGYEGHLFWSLSLSSSSASNGLSACYKIPVLPVQGPASTTLLLGAGTACSSALPGARTTSSHPMAAHAEANGSLPSPWKSVPVAAALFVCCLLPGLRKLRPLPPLFLLLILVAATGLSGCGTSSSPSGSGSGGSGPPTPVIQPAVFNATLTARDSVNASLTASTTFTLTVQ